LLIKSLNSIKTNIIGLSKDNRTH